VAPQVQRMLADDLMAAVFPDAAACLENIPGDREIPDHPLVNQTVRDCLQEAMDFEGLRAVLRRIHDGELRLVARDTPETSLFACEILNAKPYAFLDDAPLEERRAHAVQSRRAGEPSMAGDLGALDAAAIQRVRDEERPDPRDADELHDALIGAGFLTDSEVTACGDELREPLVRARRAARVTVRGLGTLWVAAERLPELLAVHPDARVDGNVTAPGSRLARTWTRADAIVELLRGRMAFAGPIHEGPLAASLAIGVQDAHHALLALESDGVVLRGRFTPGADGVEWCDRALLARIHRYTLNRLRAEIEPVSAADFMRFLFRWQHVEPSARLTGIDGLREIAVVLDGFELAAAAWERAVLPARMDGYDPAALDMLCLAGEIGWRRLSPIPVERVLDARLTPATPIALFVREHADAWQALRSDGAPLEETLPGNARTVLGALRARGASFFSDLASECSLDPADARRAIGTLVACGLAASDGYSGLRALIWAARGRPLQDRRANFAGRWTALPSAHATHARELAVECQAWALLRRYGVVFRRLLEREPNAAPWRELTRVYRALEARGQIRGGRFVAGMSGEQFAAPDAVPQLREVRRTPPDGRLIALSTADPLNLAGIVTPGDRIRAVSRNRIVYRDGVPLAAMEGEAFRAIAPIDPGVAAEVTAALRRRHVPALIRR
jgi:ATP-dependent Lhr-like helicase